MTYPSKNLLMNNKGLGIAELLGSVVVFGMVMLLIGSVSFFVYNTNKKIVASNEANINSIVITRQVMNKITNFNPQTVIQPGDANYDGWKTRICGDDASECLLLGRFSYIPQDEAVIERKLVSGLDHVLIMGLKLDTNNKLSIVEYSNASSLLMQNKVGDVVYYYHGVPAYEFDATKEKLEISKLDIKLINPNPLHEAGKRSMFEITPSINATTSETISFSVKMNFILDTTKTQIPYAVTVENRNKKADN